MNLEKLYVLGTNCVDNGPREGLDKFLKAASSEPETVLHYEFMQDYKVHLKHLDGHIEEQMIWLMLLRHLVTAVLTTQMAWRIWWWDTWVCPNTVESV